MTAAPDEQQNQQPPPLGQVSPWEWVVAGLGVLLTASLVLYLGFQALSGGETPPDVTLRQTAVEQVTEGWRIAFTADNRGGETAAHVRISGELMENGRIVERRETLLDYLPGRSRRDGGLFFAADPGRYELRLRAEGYSEP